MKHFLSLLFIATLYIIPFSNVHSSEAPIVTMNRTGEACLYGPTSGITLRISWNNNKATEAHISTSSDFDSYFKKENLENFTAIELPVNFKKNSDALILYPGKTYYARMYEPNDTPMFSEVTQFVLPKCDRPETGYRATWTASCGDSNVFNAQEKLPVDEYQNNFTGCGTQLGFGCSPKNKSCSVPDAQFNAGTTWVTREICTTNKLMNFCWQGIEGIEEIQSDTNQKSYGISDIGCENIIQIDVWEKSGNTSKLIDYVTYYTGDCAPTPTPIPAWYKLKNASLHKKNTLNITIPSSMQLYDSTHDTLDEYPLIGGAGIVTTNATNIIIHSQSEKVSKFDWAKTTYSSSNRFLKDLPLFVTYAKSKNKVNIITDIKDMQSGVINIIPNNYTLDLSHQIPESIDNSILIVQGNLNINQQSDQIFNPSKRSLSIIATESLKVHSNFTEINGIFIAKDFDFAYDIAPNTYSNTPLKVHGNLISYEQITASQLKRTRTNTNQPSLFVVLNLKTYVDLLPLLSTITFEGRQIQ